MPLYFSSPASRHPNSYDESKRRAWFPLLSQGRRKMFLFADRFPSLSPPFFSVFVFHSILSRKSLRRFLKSALPWLFLAFVYLLPN